MRDGTGAMTSSKPYLIRAIYEWILDNQMTPHLVVDADYPETSVPREFVEDGRIVLNVSPGAVRGLVIGNDWIQFNARFSGVAREVMIPTEAAVGIFTRENGQGMVFPQAAPLPSEAESAPEASRPTPRPVADENPGSGPRSSSRQPKTKDRDGPTLKVVK